MMIERPQDEEMNMSAQAREQEMNEDADHLLSWDEWLRRHVSQLLLFARQQSRSAEDAEDILQDALIRLARKEAAGEFMGGQEAWLSYVFASIRRLAVDYGRKADRRQRREDEACSARSGARMRVRTPGFPALRRMRSSSNSWRCSSKSSLPNFPKSLC